MVLQPLQALVQAWRLRSSFQKPEWQGTHRLLLPPHMHQVAAHHPIRVHHQVVEGLLPSWRAGDGGNAIGFIANGNQAWIALDLLLETGLGLVAIEIEADRSGSEGIDALEGRTQQAVIQGPAVALEVGFVDAHHRDRPGQGLVAGVIGAIAQMECQVVDEQVGGLDHGRMLQSH